MSESTLSRGPDAEPFIKWNHVDGPMLVCKDGTCHFLSKVELLWLRFGFTNIHQLDSKYNNEPQRG